MHQDYLLEYQQYLLARNKEMSTIKIYTSEIRHFLRWLQEREKKLSEVNSEDILSVCQTLHGNEAKFSTMNKSVSILSGFFKWAMMQGYVKDNPAAYSRLLDHKKNDLPKWLSAEEEAQLLHHASKERNPFKKARNEALIYVMLFAGLRVDEVSQLRLDSIRDGVLAVYDDGRESRHVPLDEKTRQKLLNWIEERSKANKPYYEESPYLFVTARSAKMQSRAIQFVVESYSERLGFPILCQHLRNTYCRRLVEQGMTVEQVKQLAGHKSVLTTWRYFLGLNQS